MAHLVNPREFLLSVPAYQAGCTNAEEDDAVGFPQCLYSFGHLCVVDNGQGIVNGFGVVAGHIGDDDIKLISRLDIGIMGGLLLIMGAQGGGQADNKAAVSVITHGFAEAEHGCVASTAEQG
ncbi:hypothetical protein D3C81_1640820 [compost metagenome]